MINRKELDRWKLYKLAEELSITPKTLRKRLNNKEHFKDFTELELDKLKQLNLLK